MKQEFKIYEIKHSCDEKEWVSGRTIIEALQTYCSVTAQNLNEIDFEAEMKEVPKEKWEDYRVMDEEDLYSEDEEGESEVIKGISFAEWMRTREQPDYIAGTMF